MDSLDCVVIGGGVVGLAVARELALRGREVVLLEAEASLGQHTSSRSSEVLHAGIYYQPGSLKARLCVAGRRALVSYLRERGLPHRTTGKLLVAVSEPELAKLEQLRKLAEANGVDDLVQLSAAEVHELEPEVVAVAGLLSPSTGILDSHSLMNALKADLTAANGVVALGARVTGGTIDDAGLTLEVASPSPLTLRCKTLVNAAGLRAPSVARTLRGLDPSLVPGEYFARGHYFTLSGASPFQRLVYPVPAPGALGIHVTLDLAGRVRFGPDISWSSELSYTFDETRAATFYRAIRRYYPGLAEGALEPGYVGIRPKIAPEGAPNADFVVQGRESHGLSGLVNLFGIESPGLTACLALANEVAVRLGPA